MCGENEPRREIKKATEGSPPRVRGKPSCKAFSVERIRITPACAGKTRSCPAAPTRSRDHPRVCGENVYRREMVCLRQGSPPRVRGKLDEVAGDGGERRITPACAGKTHPRGVCAAAEKDHPRVCGENTSEMAYFRG